MSVDRISIDTNILVYAIDKNAGKKHELAVDVVTRAISEDCVLTLQALCEFYAATTKKSIAERHLIVDQIHDWQLLFPTITQHTNTLTNALAAVDNYQLSFWDAMLWETVRGHGVKILLSEDFNHAQIIGGVRIVNPLKRNAYWTVI